MQPSKEANIKHSASTSLSLFLALVPGADLTSVLPGVRRYTSEPQSHASFQAFFCDGSVAYILLWVPLVVNVFWAVGLLLMLLHAHDGYAIKVVTLALYGPVLGLLHA